MCEKSFIIKISKSHNGRQKYCSLKCRSKDYYNKYYQHFIWKKLKPCEMCNIDYIPGTIQSKTCSRKCSSKRWKILNIEKSRAYNNASTKRCRERDPERYRFYVKNRKHRLRESSGGVSTKTFSTVFTLSNWEEIKLKYKYKCAICGVGNVKLTIDHIIPLSKNGKHSKENIQPLCSPCNSRKKDKLIT